MSNTTDNKPKSLLESIFGARQKSGGSSINDWSPERAEVAIENQKAEASTSESDRINEVLERLKKAESEHEQLAQKLPPPQVDAKLAEVMKRLAEVEAQNKALKQAAIAEYSNKPASQEQTAASDTDASSTKKKGVRKKRLVHAAEYQTEAKRVKKGEKPGFMPRVSYKNYIIDVSLAYHTEGVFPALAALIPAIRASESEKEHFIWSVAHGPVYIEITLAKRRPDRYYVSVYSKSATGELNLMGSYSHYLRREAETPADDAAALAEYLAKRIKAALEKLS